MKKTIQINIGNRLFNIDEDAYLKLDNYLQNLRNSLGPGPESDEIIADIEDRIADLLSEMKQHNQTSVSIADIDSIIDTMGTPQDIQAEEVMPGDTTNAVQAQTPKKLHRILDGAFIGGVCNGVSDYFNIDVSIVRLILVLLVLGSWGSLIVLYIILWIILPVGEYSPVNSPRKKLYRDLDNALVGGVLAGIGQYFGYTARNVRLVFLIPFILVAMSALSGPFSMIFSTGILWSILSTEVVVYLILWATVPPAITTTDRMDMMGQPVNVESIKSQVYGSKSDTSRKNNPPKTVSQNTGCGRVLQIAFFGFVALAAIAIIIGSLSGASLLMGMGLNLGTLKDFIFANNSSSIWMNIIIISVVLAPLLTIAYLLSRRSRRSSTAVKNLGLAALITWVIAIVGSASMFGLLARDFRAQVSKSSDIAMPTSSDTLYVSYLEKQDYEIDYSAGLQDYIFEKNNDLYIYSITNFSTSDSPDDQFYITFKKTTNGKDVTACENRIDNMNFKHKIVGDTLYISRYITISKPEVYRGQRVSLDIALPEGKSIVKPKELGTVDININHGMVRYHKGVNVHVNTNGDDDDDDADDDE